MRTKRSPYLACLLHTALQLREVRTCISKANAMVVAQILLCAFKPYNIPAEVDNALANWHNVWHADRKIGYCRCRVVEEHLE